MNMRMSYKRDRDTMTLSNAMRLGAMQGRQLFGSMEHGGTGASCAMGAVRISLGDGLFSHMIEKGLDCKVKRLPRDGLLPKLLVVPLRPPLPISLLEAIIYLNDVKRWSRTRIADWIVANAYDFECGSLESETKLEAAELITSAA